MAKLELYVFTTDKYSGKLKIKDTSIKEIRWFNKNLLPFDKMHQGNKEWSPEVFQFYER